MTFPIAFGRIVRTTTKFKPTKKNTLTHTHAVCRHKRAARTFVDGRDQNRSKRAVVASGGTHAMVRRLAVPVTWLTWSEGKEGAQNLPKILLPPVLSRNDQSAATGNRNRRRDGHGAQRRNASVFTDPSNPLPPHPVTLDTLRAAAGRTSLWCTFFFPLLGLLCVFCVSSSSSSASACGMDAGVACHRASRGS